MQKIIAKIAYKENIQIGKVILDVLIFVLRKESNKEAQANYNAN